MATEPHKVTVQVLEDGEVVESKLLPPDEYIVQYPTKGTTIVTIKRCEP
jgi:hypothetical protein